MDSQEMLEYLKFALYEYEMDFKRFSNEESISRTALGFCYYFRLIFNEDDKIFKPKTNKVINFLSKFLPIDIYSINLFWYLPANREKRIKHLQRAIKFLEDGQ